MLPIFDERSELSHNDPILKSKENAMKSRKQAQHPHGPIKSLEELSNEYDQGSNGSKSK